MIYDNYKMNLGNKVVQSYRKESNIIIQINSQEKSAWVSDTFSAFKLNKVHINNFIDKLVGYKSLEWLDLSNDILEKDQTVFIKLNEQKVDKFDDKFPVNTILGGFPVEVDFNVELLDLIRIEDGGHEPFYFRMLKRDDKDAVLDHKYSNFLDYYAKYLDCDLWQENYLNPITVYKENRVIALFMPMRSFE
jgi:hypothetical protein